MTLLNESWTSTAAGTPPGDLLRQFWFPVAPVGYLDSTPIREVRVLSEGLVLFQVQNGDVGLMQQRCPHNAVALREGSVDADGLVCYEHGWHFSVMGDACLKLPRGPFPLPRFKGVAYPVRAHGDLYWAYLGPEPAPPLPEDDVLVRTDGYRVITVSSLPQNWLADDWCESTHWQRQFGGAEKIGTDADKAPLLLRLPADDRTTQQLNIEFVPGSTSGAKVIYLEDGQASLGGSRGDADRASLFQALRLLR